MSLTILEVNISVILSKSFQILRIKRKKRNKIYYVKFIFFYSIQYLQRKLLNKNPLKLKQILIIPLNKQTIIIMELEQ